ncbi:MAG: hypothetical protein MZW92_81400 [Comamonadaceae bacterium]|nr:hypothetical protein [Comamonadaceae bacterium]
MPVHWYYDVAALQRDFGTIRDYQAPKDFHPNSIMALASTGPGRARLPGRRSGRRGDPQGQEIVLGPAPHPLPPGNAARRQHPEPSISDKIESIVFAERIPCPRSASTRQQSCRQPSVNSLHASSARWRREGFPARFFATFSPTPKSPCPSRLWTVGCAPTR